jgi:predicted DNA-binding transcriptional regulator YafY
MNRLDRLTAILIQLQTKRWVTSNEIANRFDISQRTVYRDIRSLEEAGIPIGAEAGRGYYLVEGFRLPPVMFTRAEAGALLVAEKLVQKFADVSVNKNITTAIDKIKAVLPEKEKYAVEDLDERVAVFHSKITGNSEYPNEYISTIQQALVEKKCISLSYHAFHSQEKTKNRIVDPLGLVFYSQAWHLIGFCKMRQDMRDFRVDRIQQLFITDEYATEKKRGDLNAYFKEYWKNSELLEVKVWFTNSIVNTVVRSRYYFGYIDEFNHENGVVMSFAVSDFNYIAHWLLSFGNSVKILQPVELADEIVSIVRELGRHYLAKESPALSKQTT